MLIKEETGDQSSWVIRGIMVGKLEILTYRSKMEAAFYKTRLRNKGQITVPSEVRKALGAKEGDDLLFSTDESGRIVITRAQIISPDQAWFWSARWQRMENTAQADLDSGNVVEFDNVNDALSALDQVEAAENAED